MSERKNFNLREYQLRMIDMVSRALVFMVVLVLLVVIGSMVFLLWGNPFAGGGEVKAAPAENRRVETPVAPVADDRIENGIHVATGLKVAEGFEVVRRTCTACHSAKLVIQNRADRQGWQGMIRWMQATQGLWDLGEQEEVILTYLAANYAPEEVGRRANLDLDAIEWYILEEVK